MDVNVHAVLLVTWESWLSGSRRRRNLSNKPTCQPLNVFVDDGNKALLLCNELLMLSNISVGRVICSTDN
jgi:hypothetical protein